MLYVYGVLSDNSTYDIKRMLEQNQFEQRIEYANNRNVAGAHQGGPINNCFFKPRTFEMFLIGYLKSRRHAEYYLVLEELIFCIQKVPNTKV